MTSVSRVVQETVWKESELNRMRKEVTYDRRATGAILLLLLAMRKNGYHKVRIRWSFLVCRVSVDGIVWVSISDFVRDKEASTESRVDIWRQMKCLKEACKGWMPGPTVPCGLMERGKRNDKSQLWEWKVEVGPGVTGASGVEFSLQMNTSKANELTLDVEWRSLDESEMSEQLKELIEISREGRQTASGA